MTTTEYWEKVATLPQREVTHINQKGKLVTTVVVNWSSVLAPGTTVPDQYEYVLGYNPVDQRWETKEA